jgi:hypothetical protein
LQNDFQGNESLTIEIKAAATNPLEAFAPRLRSVGSVTGVELLSSRASHFRFELHVEKGSDVREALFRLAVAEGWILLEMQRKTTSLEEVFHKLTTA